MRILLCLVLVACGGATAPEPSSQDAQPPQDAFSDAGRPDVAPDAPDASDGQPDGSCLRCVGDTWWDVCPATPVRQPDAESCAFCGGHCDGG